MTVRPIIHLSPSTDFVILISLVLYTHACACCYFKLTRNISLIFTYTNTLLFSHSYANLFLTMNFWIFSLVNFIVTLFPLIHNIWSISRYMMEHIINIISSFLYLCLSPSLSRPPLITSSPLWRAAWRREPKASLCQLVASGYCASWTTSTCLLMTYLAPNLHLNCCASGSTTASGMTTRNSPKSLSR